MAYRVEYKINYSGVRTFLSRVASPDEQHPPVVPGQASKVMFSAGANKVFTSEHFANRHRWSLPVGRCEEMMAKVVVGFLNFCCIIEHLLFLPCIGPVLIAEF